ncbi:MAG: hypothetical protein R6W70_04450 [bacterium]
MKVFIFLFFLFFSVFPAVAESIEIAFVYFPESVRFNDKKISENYHWKYTFTEPAEYTDREIFYLVITGHSEKRDNEQLLTLSGISVSRYYYMLPEKGSLIFENKESLERSFSITDRNGELVSTVSVPPSGRKSFVFDKRGDYTIKDTKYSLEDISVKVVRNATVLSIKDRKEYFRFEDISPGSYDFKVYYKNKWKYSENLTVISNSSFKSAYKIENGLVKRIASDGTRTGNVSGRIISDTIERELQRNNSQE